MNKFVKGVLQTVEIAGKTVVSSIIPIEGAGTLLTSIYDTVKNNCLEKRQKRWQETLENRISKMEATLDDLGNSEIFTTAIIKSTELAMKTSSEEKLKYLANATANSYEENIDETRFYLYMGFIERYTVRHISIMKEYIEPTAKEIDSTNENDVMIFNQLVVDGMILYSNDAKGEYILSPFGNDFILYLANPGA